MARGCKAKSHKNGWGKSDTRGFSRPSCLNTGEPSAGQALWTLLYGITPEAPVVSNRVTQFKQPGGSQMHRPTTTYCGLFSPAGDFGHKGFYPSAIPDLQTCCQHHWLSRQTTLHRARLSGRGRGDILHAWCQTPPWLPLLPWSWQLCMSADMLATACLYSSPRTSRCLPMFLNRCWLSCKKQEGCEGKRNHGNLNFTPSLKIPSSSSWMPQHTICKVPGFYIAVAMCLGKPGSRAQHFFGYTARLDSCSDLQLNRLWLQNGSIPCTTVVDVQVNSTKPLCLVASLMQTLQQNVGCTQLCSGSSGMGHAAPQESTATKNGFYYVSPQRCFHKRRKKPLSFFSVIDFVSENIMLRFSYQLLKSLELLRLWNA